MAVRKDPFMEIEALRPLLPGLEILDSLGSGGMGVVYKARQKSLDRLVAVKTLMPGPGHQADFALRFEREAQLMARLNHPNLVTVHDFGEIDRSSEGGRNLYYLVMEYVEGADVATLLRSGAFDASVALSLFGQLCDAIQYAHDEGVTHRDIKPANLLVDRKGRLKVADFGLAKVFRCDESLAEGLTMTGLVMGTPHYMAPEQWDANGPSDHRADIYSLGVILYEMLTGIRPVGVFSPPSRLLRIDPRIDEIVSKAMERDPERRFQRASEFKAATKELSGVPGNLSLRLRLYAGAIAALAAVLVLAVSSKFSKTPTHSEKTMEPPAEAGQQPTGALSHPSSEGGLAFASRERPYENSLGMKFVPVPGTEALFCIHETRHRDYGAFVAENPQVSDAWTMQTIEGFMPGERPEDHPAIRINWHEAVAFCDWLGQKEGIAYRLPSDREWSLAVGLQEFWKPGDTPQSVVKDLTPFLWGTGWPPPAGAGNYGDLSRKNKAPGSLPGTTYTYIEDYDDGFPTTAPVMSFQPNRFGLFDLGGNVLEWVEDWYSNERTRRTLRGGALGSAKFDDLRSALRIHHFPTDRHYYCGFRVVIDLTRPSRLPPPGAGVADVP